MDKIIPLIQQSPSKNIVITTHHKPDGDAMGSTLALYHFLKNLGLHSTVITPTDYADFLTWLPGNNQVVIFEEAKDKCRALVANADFIFCLDFNKLTRINEMGVEVEKSKAKKILMDHHPEPNQFDDMQWWNSAATSTCEQVYKFILAEGYHDKMDANVAACIYTGMMTDTGGFRFRGVSSETHLIVADLLKTGIIPADIHAKVYDSFTEDRLRLIGFSLSERMEVLHEYKTVLIHLTKEDLQRFNVKTGDTEGLVNYGLGIDGTILSALIIDRTVMVKMSFRSKGNFDVNYLAKNLFGGGGHVNAAGANSYDTLENVISTFKNSLADYKDQLK
ncbi:MAG: bifunctional oligoribonuclease/PAP phosphatase NrnA [Bacteroidia bacterium]|nr:bifunctional oligoribonuclease/PAP phosphatase NrnA [Bacteroidota bacterium]MCZ2130019.1 bifunctional oligoribonuclease/PAP phosphatase NrnA [Bacteroidia bacterium]